MSRVLYPFHGGNRHAAARELGMPDDHVIDFSASVNPLGPPSSVHSTLRNMGSSLAEYPDPDSTPFCEAVSEYLKVSLDQILVTNGSAELIHLLPRLLERRKEALILNPCFSEYEHVFQLNRVPVHSLNYEMGEMFHMDSKKVVNYLRNHPEIEMLILGHPNNPTGHVWSEDALDTLVQYCKTQRIIMVVDEAFIEFCDETMSVLKWMQNNRHLVVIRSMTKFFGLAGVRLGYGVMHPTLKARLKKYQIPWSVNVLAQILGTRVLEDVNHAQQTRIFVRQQRQRFFMQLNGIEGIHVFPSHANFLLFQLSDGCAEKVHDLYINLMKEGLLVRNCGNFNGLDKSYFRVAVRAKKENTCLASRIEVQLQKVLI